MLRIGKFIILIFIALIFLITARDANAVHQDRSLPCSSIGAVGDLDNNGNVGDADIAKLNDFISGAINFSVEQKIFADVNGDGKWDNIDVSLFNQYVNGDITTFAICNNYSSPSVECNKGDVNGDGNVNIVDALFIAQYTVGSKILSSDQLIRGDVNLDSTTNIVDALFIAQFTVGNRNAFGVCPPFPGGLIPCGRFVDDIGTGNIDESQPCTLCSMFYMLKKVINFVMELAIGVGVFIFIIAGLTYSVSIGDSHKIEQVKSIITSAIIGVAIIFIAWAAIAIILQGIGYANIGTWNQVDCTLPTPTPSS